MINQDPVQALVRRQQGCFSCLLADPTSRVVCRETAELGQVPVTKWISFVWDNSMEHEMWGQLRRICCMQQHIHKHGVLLWTSAVYTADSRQLVLCMLMCLWKGDNSFWKFCKNYKCSETKSQMITFQTLELFVLSNPKWPFLRIRGRAAQGTRDRTAGWGSV